MADVPDPPPIPRCLRAPLRALLRGEAADWPAEATADDAAQLLESIEQNGVGAARLRAAFRIGRFVAISRSARHRHSRCGGREPRLADLRAVLDAFAGSGIRVLIIKGTGLAYDIYRSPELRPRGDTDLLIAESRSRCDAHDSARARLQSQLTSGDTLAVRQQSFTRDGHVYDVHWDVANSPVVRDALPFEELLGRAIAMPRIASERAGAVACRRAAAGLHPPRRASSRHRAADLAVRHSPAARSDERGGARALLAPGRGAPCRRDLRAFDRVGRGMVRRRAARSCARLAYR